jgi:DNA replication protein DnaC
VNDSLIVRRLQPVGDLASVIERYPRQMDAATVRGLTNSQWVGQHLGVLLTGPTGIGKSWLGQALAQKACRDGYTVFYKPAAKLFRDLAQARADGSLGRLLETIARTDVLLVDDFAMAPLNDAGKIAGLPAMSRPQEPEPGT